MALEKSSLGADRLNAARQLFLNTCRFTATLTEVAQEVAANLGAANDFNFFNQWAVEQERFLNANTARNFANCNTAGVLTFVIGANHNTLEHLNTLFVAFLNFLVNANCVTTASIDNCLLFFVLG